MDFRRIPFQFSSADPSKRQAELQKRFGLSTDFENMHDFSTPSSMSSEPTEASSATSSPRLQHRVPIFYEGTSEPVKTAVDSMTNQETNRKPHVRIIPIEIEGEHDSNKRHRSLSGSATVAKGLPNQNGIAQEDIPFKCTVSPKVSSVSKPRVCNIPIKIQRDSQSKELKSSDLELKTTPSKILKGGPLSQQQKVPNHNGCNLSKEYAVAKIPEPPKPVDDPVAKIPELPNPVDHAVISLKNIEGIVEKLKDYEAEVEEFFGTVKEKRYRYLDEMLTRLMLDLDDIDTNGNEEVRLSRKSAVKKVQACIDLLESKVIRESKAKPEVESSKNEIKPTGEFATVVEMSETEINPAGESATVVEMSETETNPAGESATVVEMSETEINPAGESATVVEMSEIEPAAEDVEMEVVSTQEDNTLTIEDVSENIDSNVEAANVASSFEVDFSQSNVEEKSEGIEVGSKPLDIQTNKEDGYSNVMEVDESINIVVEPEPIIEEPDSSDEMKVEAKLDLASIAEKPELVDSLTECDESRPVVTELETDSDSCSSGDNNVDVGQTSKEIIETGGNNEHVLTNVDH